MIYFLIPYVFVIIFYLALHILRRVMRKKYREGLDYNGIQRAYEKLLKIIVISFIIVELLYLVIILTWRL